MLFLRIVIHSGTMASEGMSKEDQEQRLKVNENIYIQQHHLIYIMSQTMKTNLNL